MKGAYESYLIIFFGMLFTLIGFSMVQITMQYNNARLYQETIITLVERHNRYDGSIDELIKNTKQTCNGCTYKVSRFDNKYKVDISFDIAIKMINFEQKARISALTQSIV